MDCRDIRHELNELVFPTSYFEDEVREGFYVPTMMKRYWAGQLKVLAEIDKICRKHSIKWFAIYGTLIGAVRHGGFIPWDDDLDICMLRKDYERFFEIAREELPEKYTVLDVRFEPEYEYMLGRIVNNRNVVDYSEEHMKEYMHCPYTIGVDVFSLDDICDDNEKEEARVELLRNISKAVDLINSCSIDSDEGNKLLTSIEADNNIKLHRSPGLKRELLLLSNDLYTKYSSDNASHVALMPIWVEHKGNRFPKRIFEHTINLPFENTYLPVPGIYDELLRIAYGDYMVINRGGGIHNYPVYEDQEKILKESIGENPYRYTFSYDEFAGMVKERRHHKKTDELCREMAEMLHTAALRTDELIKAEKYENAMKLLESSQNIAISLGTMLEDRVRESTEVIRLLEDYCELLYECHEDIEGNRYASLIDNSINIQGEVERCLNTRNKKVLFLPCTAKWWGAMKPYYEKLKESGSCDVIVAPIPYYELSDDMNAERIDYVGEFPEDVDIVQVTEYDFEHGYADEIVIQIPYDDTNLTIRVPKFFYSNNLLEYTDKLTYIPYLKTYSPEPEDSRAIKMIGLLAEQPAVINADRVILPSGGLKKVYADKLTELAGLDTREYWERKIEILETADDMKHEIKGRKLLMYYVDISYLLQYGIDVIDKMRRNITCFDDAKDSIRCVYVKEDRLKDICTSEKETNAELTELMKEYDRLCDEIEDKENYITVSYMDAESYVDTVDAYYGCAGVLAHRCRLKGSPVMIMGDVTI